MYKKDKLPNLLDITIAIIGIGYVGLPLLSAISDNTFCLKTGKKLTRKLIGFDKSKERINELINNIDKTKELSVSKLDKLNSLDSVTLTYELDLLHNADLYIITVPTPVDQNNKPNFEYLEQASITVGEAMKKKETNNTNPIVIYESTVYPGATEEICIPILEEFSGRVYNTTENKGFYCGYSPERVNPGDKEHTIKTIVKVTSGSCKEVGLWVDDFYSSFIKAGTHLAPNIKVAEAAKVIENTQRDLNIALINELAIIFHKLGIDTSEVLKAANTKWNFLDFKPGLVGGHCIGVDPYYLTHKAQSIGYHPQLVLAGRRINDAMVSWICKILISEMSNRAISINSSEILVLGIAYKSNSTDMRNSKIIELVKELESYKSNVTIVDPDINKKEAFERYNIEIEEKIPSNKLFKAIIAANKHKDFTDLEESYWRSISNKDTIFIDLQGFIYKGLNPIRI